jgi:hypothetical protein
MSFRQFSIERGMKYSVYKEYKNNYEKYLNDGYDRGSCWIYMENFEQKYPMIADIYFDIKYEEVLYLHHK